MVECLKKPYCVAMIADHIGGVLDTDSFSGICDGPGYETCSIANCTHAEFDVIREGGFLFRYSNLTPQDLNWVVDGVLEEHRIAQEKQRAEEIKRFGI